MPVKTKTPISINITTSTILKVVGILLVCYLALLIKEILVVMFVALVLANAFDPLVDYLGRHKWPRALSISLIYVIVLGLVVLMFYFLVPIVIKEATDFATSLPYYVSKISAFLDRMRQTMGQYGLASSFQTNLDNLATTISGWTMQLITAVYGAVNGLFPFF